tara:strand:- start:1033 stop:2580 length:1548 start_codon:yes stop_codon:yes gene_type:complete
MNDIVVIGKVTGSTANIVEVEYPSMVGVNHIRIPRTLVGRLERISNGRVAVLVRTDDSARGQEIDDILINQHAPLHVTDEHMNIVMAMENNEPMPGDSVENDDEVPMWSNEASLSITVDGVEAGPAGPFDDMLYAGGRKEKASIDWDFDPVRKPAFVVHESNENTNMGATVARVNGPSGEPAAYHIFNPHYAEEKRPAGAYLGTFSASYYPMPYRKGFGPVLDLAAEKGWPAQVIAWDEGKRAACFCDVTTSVDWESAGRSLGDKWQQRGFAKTGDYRIGIAIHNSLDGSSAFKVQAVAERLACTNGMVMGDRATLVNLKHTKGVLGNYDFDSLADKISEVIQAAADEIIVAESMRGIEVNRDTFEKLMTICERKGLITKPTLKRDDEGNVVSINRGHMWRLMGQGWTKPSESWVAVSGEDKGTLYHAYNILTGAITHKPTWTDGTAVLNGSTMNFNTFHDRLHTVHKVLGDLTKDVYNKLDMTETQDLHTTKSASANILAERLANVPMFSEVLH